MKYIVFYSEGCSPKIKLFKTGKGATAFATRFLKKNKHNTDDNWVDGIIYGEIVDIYDGHFLNEA